MLQYELTLNDCLLNFHLRAIKGAIRKRFILKGSMMLLNMYLTTIYVERMKSDKSLFEKISMRTEQTREKGGRE